MSQLDDKECESWTDVDVWYWVFENGFEQEHAEAMWNNQVDGKTLVHLKKDQLFGMCKTLDKRKTSDMWHKIKGLKKNVPKQRKSFLRNKSRPAPVAADYSDDDDVGFSDSSDFSDDENQEEAPEEMGDSQTSLHDLLKQRLQEFKEQQAEEANDMYIAPDSQDNYEEFDTVPDNGGDDQLYLTPPGDDEDAPPPPPRDPLGAKNSSSVHRAPALPPRPGAKPLPSPSHMPLPPPGQKLLSSPAHKRLPSPGRSSVNSDENSGEEYVVPDPITADSEEMYLDPNESNEPDDCCEEYLDPNEVPRPEPPLPAPPIQRRDKSPKRTIPALNGRSRSSILPPKPTSKPEHPTSHLHPSKSVGKLFTSITSQFESKTSSVPKPPIPTSNNRPKPPQGGSMWQIQKNLKSQVPQPNPPRPAIPTPSQPPTPQLPSPRLPARSSDSLSSRPSEPVRPARSEPVRPPVPVSSRPRPSSTRGENDLSNCPWFHETLDRTKATAALNRHKKEGAFVVRKSDKNINFPYSLSLYYKGSIRNLQIGIRDDKKYALGKLKEGEGRFSSVKELIDYHRTHDVVLANNDGRTCLIEPVPIP